MIDASNLVIYMSDSIRWDSIPEEIQKKGEGFKTISASSHTPTSIASMLTGQYLPQHGVGGFTDVIPEETPTILDQFEHSGLSDVGGMLNDDHLGKFFNETIYDYPLQRYDRLSLDDIQEPFGWFMRDPGGHAPYGRWDMDMNAEISVPDFFTEHAGDTENLRKMYEKGINDSINRFEKYVLQPLKDRDLLDDTLIIFLSDHGELLGEYGHVSQSYPMCPEIVYVPTFYIHPDLPSIDIDITSHVDLPVTVSHLLDKEPFSDTPGSPIFDPEYDRETAYCLYNRRFPSFQGEFNYRIDSKWDKDGGHVFVRSNIWSKIKLTIGYLTRISAGKHLRKTRNPTGFKLLFSDQKTWGSPDFPIEQSDKELGSIDQHLAEKVERAMTKDTEDRLKDLGYL
ncbi:sulfatase-like hydrolase/transferase [Natronorubrum sp. JWXQ-INN-674]|uniref:Sulfatase-like hydrolase/transferase n=1 Tax=Natronorubrum halalkaliphilum TaxID=2691917 RepID=A0A6B0VJZ6_9EURY|nr:sulfatase-like hydrolase/transferase [Natronorubrum halalkaliphilum]MXV61864.1 sulfatase-like hydrolase/transferase [Natronorubrum halalkaliphilum]